MTSESGNLFYFHNVGLFSDHFLSKRLPADSPFWTSEKASAQAAFDKIFAQYKKCTSTYKNPNEAQTEDDFIRPVLNILGYSYIVQTPLKHKGKFNQPDYSLFADEKTKKEAGSFRVKEQEAFYSKALAICDAKYWGRPLDIKLSDTKDSFTNINPSFQIVNYLVGANVDWGILTNGKLWRLYYQKASSRSSNFYEVDLEDLLSKGSIESFLYFYLFFRKNALIKDSHGKSFFDLVLEGSTHYATELSDRLKEKVFEEIFPHLARGFLHYRKAEQGLKEETEETLKQIYNGTLTLLYRLLFILYAEDRDLLPIKEENYRHYSLANIKQKVADLRDKKATLSELSTDLWSDLDTLFKIIDLGDPKLNVPTYNGGLFSHKNPKNDFLKSNKVPDPWLAEAIDHLTREHDKESGKPQSIDYSELEVRHLGSIYEGLLEFHLRIADEDKAATKEKGREVYRPLAQVKDPKGIVKKGELFLENDKHERKSTGSYYTPDYIVKYIVQNAVGPVLEEKLKKVEKLFSEVESLRAKAHRATSAKKFLTQELNAKKQQTTDELFSLKALDPAMGSGHFLVETVDFLSDHIIKFLNDLPDNPVLEEIEKLRSTILNDLQKKSIQIDEQKLTPTNLVKRMVMKRCIYGVDLNPMAVELAKLSLWLHSFTLGAPLSFLDHHLQCGNSLIGTTVKVVKESMEEVKVGEEGRYVDWEGREKVVPEQKALYLFGSQFAGLLSATELMRQVGELTDSTFEEVQESQEKYEKAADALKPFKLILDLWTSEHFGNKDARRFLTHGGDVEAFLKGNERLPETIKKLRQETEILSETKRFFHWELEFPEVFYEGAREKQNPGFDAVIGNPPYVRQEGLTELKPYFLQTYPAAHGMADVYVYFFDLGLRILQRGGRLGVISSNKFMRANYGRPLRKRLTDGVRVEQIIDFGELPVFPEAATFPAIFIIRNNPAQNEPTRYAPVQSLNFSSLEAAVNEQTLFVQAGSLSHDGWSLSGQMEEGIRKKIEEVSHSLGIYCGGKLYRGVTTGLNKAFVIDTETRNQLISEDPKCSSIIKPFLVGDDIRRYEINFQNRYLIFTQRGINIEKFPSVKKHLEKFKKELTPKSKLEDEIGRKPGDYKWYEIQDTTAYFPEFEKPKIIYPDIAITCRFAFDGRGDYYLGNTGYILPRNDPYLLAILNSKLIEFYYKLLSPVLGDPRLRGRLRFIDTFVSKIPVRRIDFTTPDKERSRLLGKGKTLYEQCLAKNDFLCVTGFVDQCLKQKPEQADVVHDLLAFLAERMMAMNKEKQAETKGFLEWLETNIGAKVESLKNKTKISAYHEGSLEDLLEMLKENRKVLKVNPASIDFFKPLKDAFEKSIAKLSPLKANLATTDRLIDLIVYRLYGLTEEETAIVGGH